MSAIVPLVPAFLLRHFRDLAARLRTTISGRHSHCKSAYINYPIRSFATTQRMTHSIQSKMMRGALWMVLFKLFDRSLGFLSTLFLVRLLAPADFGVVAMAMSFILMAEALGSFGFDIALIQHKDPTDEHYHTAWTCNVILGAAISVLLLALAWPVTHFYGHPEVLLVFCCLALGPLFASLENIGTVKFRKELQFRKEFTFRASRRFLAFAATLPLAFLLRNYWALVGGIMLSKLGGSVLSYVAQEFRPRFSLVKIRDLLHVSKWLVLNNFATILHNRSTDLFVGRLYGAATLGVYSIGQEVSNMATVELSASINRALLPSFAKIESIDELRSTYGNAMSVLALVSLPAAAGIFAVAPFLVPVVLGNQWLAATGLIEILAFNGVLLLFHSSIGSVLMARGFPGHVTKANGFYVLVLVAMLFLFGARFGVQGIAWGVLVTAIVLTPLYLYLLNRNLAIGAGVFLRATVRPVLAAFVMAVVVRMLLPVYDAAAPILHMIAWLTAGVAIGIVVYGGVIGLLWLLAGCPGGAERLVFGKFRARFFPGSARTHAK